MAITNSKIHKDTSISHIHEDPKLISQQNAKQNLKLGQVVYQDDDGKYYPAIASGDPKTSLLQGIVWEFIGDHQFYLRSAPGPMTYRHPLTADFFDSIEENEYVPNLPGEYGDILWLSQTVPGYVQVESNGAVIVGYKTDYGFLYQPKYIICCNSSSSSSRRRPPPPSSSSSLSESSSSINDSSSSSVDVSGSSSSSIPDVSGSSSSSSSSDRRKVCWSVYFATYYCGVWYHHTPGSGRTPENYVVCDYEDDYSEYNWVHDGCVAEKLVKGNECTDNSDCYQSPISDPLEEPPNCCPSSSSSSYSSSSSQQSKKCMDLWQSICQNGAWQPATFLFSQCTLSTPTNIPYMTSFNQWFKDPAYTCYAYYAVQSTTDCTRHENCSQFSTTPATPTFPIEPCCGQSSSSSSPPLQSSSSSSLESFDYVCIWEYTAEWVCLANGNTGGWYVWKTLLSCQSTVDFELPPSGWTGSGCTRTALVPKFSNTPCNPPDNDCCYPAPDSDRPSLETLPDRDTMNNLCCNYVYWKYTCTAAPHCSNGVLDWTVTGSLSNNFFYATVPDTNWNNIVDECSDGRTYWVGPYLRSLSRDDIIALDPPSCGVPSTAPGSGCMPCSSSSSSNVCPPISPPIGFVNVTISGYTSWEAEMVDGTYTVPLNNNSGSVQVYQILGDGQTTTGSISITLVCASSPIDPCPSPYPNSVCGCFDATLPAGWYYDISVGVAHSSFGGGSYSRLSRYAQPKNGGSSMQSYTGFVNFAVDDRACDPNLSATVS